MLWQPERSLVILLLRYETLVEHLCFECCPNKLMNLPEKCERHSERLVEEASHPAVGDSKCGWYGGTRGFDHDSSGHPLDVQTSYKLLKANVVVGRPLAWTGEVATTRRVGATIRLTWDNPIRSYTMATLILIGNPQILLLLYP